MAEPRIQQNYFVPSVLPNGGGGTVGTSSIQAIGANSNRARLVFHNPNAAANIAICPVTDLNGNPLAAVINGPGSIMIFPGSSYTIEGVCYNAFNVISDTPGSAYTVWES